MKDLPKFSKYLTNNVAGNFILLYSKIFSSAFLNLEAYGELSQSVVKL